MSHLNSTSEVTFLMAVTPLSCCNQSTGLCYKGVYDILAYRGALLHLSGTGEWPYSEHKQHIHSRALHSGRGLQKGICNLNKNSDQPVVLRDYRLYITTVSIFFHKKLGSEDSLTRNVILIHVRCKKLCQFSHRVITNISIVLCSFSLLIFF